MTTCEKRILIVEDDRDVREALAEVLDGQGYEAVAAANGAEAIAELRASAPERPCLILLDVMMPVMDGWQFRAATSADPELARIPVVVITAHTDARAAAAKMGAQGFLSKPIDLDALGKMITRFCAPPA
jgi:CheY-like chemotaxis protein